MFATGGDRWVGTGHQQAGTIGMPYSLGMHPVPGMLCYHIYILAALLPLHATLAYTASVVAFDMNMEQT